MNNDNQTSGSMITKLLVAAIVVATIALFWLLYSRVVEPRLAANVDLTEQVCFSGGSELCFRRPSSWVVTEEVTDSYQRLALDSPGQESTLSIAVGDISTPLTCDQREKRSLHILSSQPVEDMADVDDKPVHVVKAVLETAADGFLVPLMYLTTDEDQLEAGILQTCALAGANIIRLASGQQLVSGIDDHNSYVGSTAPSFRSLGEAKEWLSTPRAVVGYRVLSSLSYQP